MTFPDGGGVTNVTMSCRGGTLPLVFIRYRPSIPSPPEWSQKNSPEILLSGCNPLIVRPL